MTVRYSSGQHRLVASDRCVALLPSDLDDALLADIWTEVSTATDLLRVIDVLLSRGLGTVPNLAMAMRGEHGVQVIVRGTGRAYSGGAWHDSGGRATWSEIDLPGPSVTLRLDDSGEPSPRIPLLGGVVLAGSVALELEPEGSNSLADGRNRLAAGVAIGTGVGLAAEALDAEADRGPFGERQATAASMADQSVGEANVHATPESDAGVDEQLEPAAAIEQPEVAAAPEQDPGEPVDSVQVESEPTPEPTPEAEVQVEAEVQAEDDARSQGEVEPESDEDSYDRLFDLTYHGVSPGAVPVDVPAADLEPAEPAAAEPVAAAEELTSGPGSDHREYPVDAIDDDDDMPELTVVRPPDPPARAAAQPNGPVGPLVSALRCPRGHLNPPGTSVCRVCASGIGPQTPNQVPRPPLGVLLAAEAVPGAPRRIPLDSDLLIGRRPAHGPVPDQGVRLVTIPSPERDISRRHLRVSLDGWAVLITDLGSTNGTTVSLPGRTAREVRSGEVVPIVAGTRLTLADVATYVFEVE